MIDLPQKAKDHFNSKSKEIAKLVKARKPVPEQKESSSSMSHKHPIITLEAIDGYELSD